VHGAVLRLRHPEEKTASCMHRFYEA